jgi:hypothetical protein
MCIVDNDEILSEQKWINDQIYIFNVVILYDHLLEQQILKMNTNH